MGGSHSGGGETPLSVHRIKKPFSSAKISQSPQRVFLKTIKKNDRD